MKLQGSSIEEDGNVQVSEVKEISLQNIHQILREYFAGEKKLEVFEILSATKDKNWKIRVLIQYAADIRICSLSISLMGLIESLQEEFRAVK